MKTQMKRLKQLVVWLLLLSMLSTSSTMMVYATDNEKSVIAEEKVSEVIGQQNDNSEIGENSNTDVEDSVSEKKKAFEYVYVDEQAINIPEEQNIVVAFADTDIKIETAILYGSIAESEETFEISSSNIVDNTILFTKNYTEEEETGTYRINSIAYRIQGMEQTVKVSFEDQNITAQYIVTSEPEKEMVTKESSDVPEISVYSVDENGSTVQQSGDTESIEDSVESVLSTVDDTAEEESLEISKTRTARTGDKVIVICAGHDANHPGASGSGLREEQLTFKVAQYCKAELEKYSGVKVYMDRSSVSCAYPGQSSGYCLNQRVIDAAAKGATTFVDIHFNKANGAAYGAEIYVPNNSYSSAIHQDGENLGNNILAQLSALGLYNRGTKVKDCTTNDRDKNGILEDYFTTNNLSKAYGMTGIIVEHAFLDNANDAAKLKNESFLQQLGVADATGIANAYGLTKGAKIEILNKDDFAGTAQIKIAGAGSGARAAIWSSVDGQDDLKWIDINNSQTINFNIKDYKNSTGTYNVHLYGANGSFTAITFKVSTDTTSKLTITNVNEQDKTFHLTLKFNDMPDEITSIQFPTWCAEGQSDIKWYQGKQTSKGVWEADVPIIEHKLSGRYNVHIYATMNESLKFIGSDTFNVSEPNFTGEIQNYNKEKGTFEVTIKDISAVSGVDSVVVPVWSVPGQSNIVWYPAEKQSDGTYKVKVKIANHGYLAGKYKVHAYLTANNGITKAISVGQQEMSSPDMKITAENTDAKETQYILKIANANVVGNVKNVQFAVWSSENGQDDLIWYQGKEKSTGYWTATADIRKHKTAGTYNVHVYTTMKDGSMKFVGSTTFNVSEPNFTGEIQNYNKEKGTFEVIIKDISAVSGVDSVVVPVWSVPGQSNIVWYPAEKQSDGTYKVKVKIANHGYLAGKYKVHAYLTANNGITKAINVGQQEMIRPGIKISAENIDEKEMQYNLKAINTNIAGNVKHIQFATWSSKNGQDDLVWYQGKEISTGYWTATADIRKHKTAGVYNVHVYATMADGNMEFLGATTFSVTEPNLSADIMVENYEENTGAFTVKIAINSNVALESVQVPIWCEANQGDIKWYLATLDENGKYEVRVEPVNHKYNVGLYKIHVYATTANNIWQFVGSSSQMVVAPAHYTIMGDTTVTLKQMVDYYKASGYTYPTNVLSKGGAATLEEFCQIYLEEAKTEGVRAEVAFAQAMKETKWLQYGGMVKVEQFNYAGIAALDGNSIGQCASFPDVRTGIRAQIQHLKAYGSKEDLVNKQIDPRFNLVARGIAPYVEWLGIKENPAGVGWATEKNYGVSIVSYIKLLKAM